MRKFLLFLAGFLFLTTISCREGDDEVINPVVGKWSMHKHSYTYVYNGKTTTEEEVANSCEQKSTIEFRADSKGTQTSYYDGSGSCLLEDMTQFTYSYDKNTSILYIAYPDGAESVKVESVTNTEMILSYQYDDGGTPVTVNITTRKV